MLLLGTTNIASQEVAPDNLVNLGGIYRKYCKKNSCGVPCFTFLGNGVTLNHSGIYRVAVNATFTTPATGVVTLDLYANGLPIVGATASDTTTVANTQPRSVAFETFVLVDNACVLGQKAINPQTINLVNSGVDATYTNVRVDIEKVL